VAKPSLYSTVGVGHLAQPSHAPHSSHTCLYDKAVLRNKRRSIAIQQAVRRALLEYIAISPFAAVWPIRVQGAEPDAKKAERPERPRSSGPCMPRLLDNRSQIGQAPSSKNNKMDLPNLELTGLTYSVLRNYSSSPSSLSNFAHLQNLHSLSIALCPLSFIY
jgi:hypothetical protein